MVQSVAMNVKAMIKQKGMVQRVVAERSGFTENGFSAMLNGRKTFLADYLPAIAHALDVTPNDLFGISAGSPSDPVQHEQPPRRVSRGED